MNSTATILSNEAALVAQSVSDSAAFADIYDHYFSRIYNYIRYRVQDAAVSDDLTAQVFERTLANIGRYRPDRAPFAAWLFAIARNVVNDHVRAQKRRRWLSLEAVLEWASHELQPGEIITEEETRAELLAAVARLSHRQRDLIGLKFGGGLTNREIAGLTGLGESNVGVILYRAVQRLRAELKAQGVER